MAGIQTKDTTQQGTEKAQEKKRRLEPAPVPMKALADESITLPGLLGVSAMELPIERHAALLGDPRFSHSANNAQKACMVTELQQNYGNAYVQRVIGLIQAKKDKTLPGEEGVLDGIRRRIAAERGSGQPLESETRSEIEAAFNQDFGGVRIHADANAAKLAKELGAKAFTTGKDIFFREGAYQPTSEAGKGLLGHELAHVMQQGGASPQADPQKLQVSQPTDAAEKEAQAVGQVWSVPPAYRGSTGLMIARLVEYNEDVTGGRFTDPEQAKGVLPFTKDGWNGKEIARKLSQLDNAVARFDDMRCVQTSFLVALVQRGPGAVREMIQNYLNRYRVGLRQATTPARIKRWYRRSIRNLKPLLAKIDSKTLTYGDLSTILTEMYDVYGTAALRVTTFGAMESMWKREGYSSVSINKKNVKQRDAAAEAKKLKEGEFLLCGVHVSKTGYEPAGHAVHISRHPDGTLYFYDPWPVKGDQMIVLSEDLKEMHHYFVNPLSIPFLVPLLGLRMLEIKIPRTFDIFYKISPPKEEAEEE